VSVVTETLDVVALRREVQKQCGFVYFVRLQIRGLEQIVEMATNYIAVCVSVCGSDILHVKGIQLKFQDVQFLYFFPSKGNNNTFLE